MATTLRTLLLFFLLGAAGLRAGETYVVRGCFLYEDKAWDYDGWTGEDPSLPIRGADVAILRAGSSEVLGRGRTDEQGEFAIECRSVLPAMVFARVDAESRRLHAELPLLPRIVVKTPQGIRYSSFSPAAPVADVAGADLGTTTALAVLVGSREGSPFNVFDMTLRAFELLAGPEMAVERRVRGGVHLYWPNVLGSYTIGRRAWISSDDGYDDAVILHEVGHVVHNLHGDSDSPGGMHYFGDSDQDPRLSFGEGWATAFGAAVLDRLDAPACYVDCGGTLQEGGVQLQLRLETAEPFFQLVQGAADEVAVACVLFDLLDGDELPGDGPGDDDPMGKPLAVAAVSPSRALWDVFTGPARHAHGLTMNHVWDGWLALHAADPHYAELQDVFEAYQLRNWADEAEPDDSPELATLVQAGDGSTWEPEHTLYRAEPGQLGPGTGDRDWFLVELQAGWHVVIETRYPQGTFDAGTQADPYLVLFDPAHRRRDRNDDSGTGRNARLEFVADASGSWRFAVLTKNRLHRYGRYEVQVRRIDG